MFRNFIEFANIHKYGIQANWTNPGQFILFWEIRAKFFFILLYYLIFVVILQPKFVKNE